MMDPEAAKTIAQIGSAAVAFGPTVKAIVERMFGPVVDVVGERFADRAKAYFERNAAETAAQAAQYVEASGREPHEIPLRTSIPLLNGASREDDPSLREMWAALMANASLVDESDSVPPYYATVLSQLSPLEAELLTFLNGDAMNEGRHPDLLFGGRMYDPPRVSQNEIEYLLQRHSRVAKERTAAAIDLLVSLGVISREKEITVIDGASAGGDPRFHPTKMGDPRVQLTPLGIRFLTACLPPKRS